jgi:serine/threonine protein kinase
MCWAERGTLRDQMSAVPLHTKAAEAQVWQLAWQTASGLAHIHAHGLLHCDVKPENVLLDQAQRLAPCLPESLLRVK